MGRRSGEAAPVRLRTAALAAAVLTAAGTVGATGASAETVGPPRGQAYALLSGAGLAAGDPDSRGTAFLRVRGSTVCYQLSWNTEAYVSEARIHLTSGQGPVVLRLFSDLDAERTTASGCVSRVQRSVAEALVERPADHLLVLAGADAPGGLLTGRLRPQARIAPLPDETLVSVEDVASAADGITYVARRVNGPEDNSVLRVVVGGDSTSVDLTRPGDDDQWFSRAVIRDGDVVWVAQARDDSGDGRVVRLDPDGTRSWFDLPGTTNPRSLSVAPDGALWVADGGGFICRVAADAGADDAVCTWVDGDPIGIAADSTGAWFVSNGSPVIGHLTADGEVTTHEEPELNGSGGAVIGPDGAFWFTDFAKGLGRIDADGTVTYRQVPQQFPGTWYASDLVVDAQGFLWFTANNRDDAPSYIGRYSVTEDSVATFFVPGATSLHAVDLAGSTVMATDQYAGLVRLTKPVRPVG